jgi:DNA-binding GntR family transcriptional regulator
MRKLKIPSDLTALAYSSIKQYILEGQTDPDLRLTEAVLSEQLGISRSPVREALNSLATEGLITIEPRRGAFLRRFSVKEMTDLYDLRIVIETYSVQRAEVTPKLLATLDKSIERARLLLNKNKKLEYIEEDMNFHGSIAEATGSAPLVSVFKNIQSLTWVCRGQTYYLSSNDAVRAHSAIAGALKAGDRERAKRAMEEHISYVRDQLIQFATKQQAGEHTKSGNGSPGRQLAGKNGE